MKHVSGSVEPLTANAAHNFATGHAMIAHRSNAICTLVPKNASTALKIAIAAANGCVSDVTTGLTWVQKNGAVFRPSLRELITADYTFVVLRDPFARLTSCFFDKIVYKRQPAWTFHDLIKMDNYLGMDELTFPDFVTGLTLGNNVKLDNHWRHQSDFLVYETYDDYFALEAFDDARARLERQFGWTIAEPRRKKTISTGRYAIEPETADYSTASAADVLALLKAGRCPHPRSLYTDDTVQKVRRLYQRDLDLYAAKLGLPMMFER